LVNVYNELEKEDDMLPNKVLQTFISYSRINQQFAIKLACELKSAGFSVWMDQFDIPTGSRWDEEIEKALHECEIFLLIMTPASIASENAKDEIGYAIDHGKRILPVLLEKCTVPLRLRRFQYVDFTQKSFNEGIKSAKELLSNLVNENDTSTSETTNTIGETIAATEATGILNEPKTVPAKKSPVQQRFQPGAKGISRVTQYMKRTSMLLPVGVSLGVVGTLIVASVLLKPLIFSPSSTSSPTSTTAPTQTINPTDTLEPTVFPATQPPARLMSFVEEFDAENRWAQDWALQFRHGNPRKQNSFKHEISDGELIFDLTYEYVWGYFLYDPAIIYNKVEMEVVVVDLNSTDTFGLICQFSDQGWYEFDINGGGKYFVRFVDNMEANRDEERYVIKTGAIPAFKYSTIESHENTIRASCNGNKLSLSVNDTEYLNGYPSRVALEQGQIGIAVRSYDKYPIHVSVKSIKVTEP
jgi:hypothetical protein